MKCKDVFITLAKHIFSFSASSLDMGFDFLNGLNFLGYCKSVSEALSDRSFLAYSSIESKTNTAIAIAEEPSENIVTQLHQIWGTLSIMMIFLPGFVFWLPEIISLISNGQCCDVLSFLLGSMFFPVYFIYIQLYAIIMTCCGKELDQQKKTRITQMTAAEAGIESTGQLMLQLFTIINGYPSGLIQKITIATSFLQIGRSVILQDIETKIWIKKEKPLKCCQSLIETLRRVPIYVPNIIFRTGSLVVTIAYLRIYSIIPILILVIELGRVSWKRFRKLNDRDSTFQVTISNLGVLNSYAFVMGARPFRNEDEDEEDVNNFIVRSSVVTFVHHSIVIGVIMTIGYFYPS